ncbi:MAG: hypothetical protein HYU39_08015 [Thaumarchaeota archaeon]|nr:hypothetical protein [Nitrososphaerota archaeon]
MHVKCPDCEKPALLTDGFDEIRCEHCGYKATYGEYVQKLVEKDATYSDVLNDYRL